MDKPPLIIQESDLPREVVYVSRQGQREVYQLRSASRKIGMSLQGVTDSIKRMILATISPRK